MSDLIASFITVLIFAVVGCATGWILQQLAPWLPIIFGVGSVLLSTIILAGILSVEVSAKDDE